VTEAEQLQRIYGVIEGWLAGDIEDNAAVVVGRIIGIREEAENAHQEDA
jgi:hypothetical protein